MKTAAKPEPLTLSGEIKFRREELLAAVGDVTEERRGKQRISYHFPTRAWGVDADGKDFDIDCTLENVSSTGLYLHLPRRVARDAELKVVINFSSGSSRGATAVLECKILRSEPKPDGQTGLAMRVKSYHFV